MIASDVESLKYMRNRVTSICQRINEIDTPRAEYDALNQLLIRANEAKSEALLHSLNKTSLIDQVMKSRKLIW